AHADPVAAQHDVVEEVDLAARLHPARPAADPLAETRQLILVPRQQALLVLDAIAQRLELRGDPLALPALEPSCGARDALDGAVHLREERSRLRQRCLAAGTAGGGRG